MSDETMSRSSDSDDVADAGSGSENEGKAVMLRIKVLQCIY